LLLADCGQYSAEEWAGAISERDEVMAGYQRSRGYLLSPERLHPVPEELVHVQLPVAGQAVESVKLQVLLEARQG